MSLGEIDFGEISTARVDVNNEDHSHAERTSGDSSEARPCVKNDRENMSLVKDPVICRVVRLWRRLGRRRVYEFRS